MRRQIAGLHAADRCAADQIPDGLFLVRVQRVQFRRQAQKPYYTLLWPSWSPADFPGASFSAGSIAIPEPYGSSTGSFATLATMLNYSVAMKSTKRS
jgi:hypothetical protein